MDNFWRIAVGLTGIAGVGAFVFYALYRDWLHLEALAGLSQDRRFRLFKWFLVLTFLFFLAALGFGAYKLRIESLQRERSVQEMRRLLEDRRREGDHLFGTLATDATLFPERRKQIEKARDEYDHRMGQLTEALSAGDQIRYHEQLKSLIDYLDSLPDDSIPKDSRETLKNSSCLLPSWQSGGETRILGPPTRSALPRDPLG